MPGKSYHSLRGTDQAVRDRSADAFRSSGNQKSSTGHGRTRSGGGFTSGLPLVCRRLGPLRTGHEGVQLRVDNVVGVVA